LPVLTISDDGVGFDKMTMNNNKSLGIPVMKERTFLINGEYEIDWSPAKGTE
jgi:signal transduction histidine kinase